MCFYYSYFLFLSRDLVWTVSNAFGWKQPSGTEITELHRLLLGQYLSGSFGSEETMELDVQSITPELQQLLTPIMIQAGSAYNQKYAYLRCERTQQIMNKFSTIRFNRYGGGQIMRQHHDHIHSLFDGNEKGIPVLSFILNLNDDYEGADLFFWENHVVPLGKGDIIMFPSLFLFPHGVTEAKSGKRYSAVSWAW